MSKEKSLRFWGIAIMAAAAFFSMASTRLVGQGYEKICPMTFRLYPGTLLERNYAAKIEKDNAKLSGFLSELRTDLKLRKMIENWLGSVGNLGKSDDQGLMSWKRMLQENIKKEGNTNPFLGTYLVDPKLTTEKGVTVIGIPAVLTELITIISNSTYIDAQSVHVYLEYLPYGSAAYKEVNAKYPPKPGEEEIDIIAHIKTVLAYAPHDDPVTIEGVLPHRRVCDPIY